MTMTKEEHQRRCEQLLDKHHHLLIDSYRERGAYQIDYMPGWFGILAELFSGIENVLTTEQKKEFRVTQIKEKFGSLRFYYRGQPLHVDIQTKKEIVSFEMGSEEKAFDAVDRLIEKAVSDSSQTCMFCGDPGELRRYDWWLTLCEYHARLSQEGRRIDADFELMSNPPVRH